MSDTAPPPLREVRPDALHVPAQRRPDEARSSAPRLGYRPALDGLRALAIVLVLLRHLAPSYFPGGGVVGVGLFFVLSGFLITWLLLQEREGSGRVDLRRFYRRRFYRLAPALYVLLAVWATYRVVAGGLAALSSDLLSLVSAATWSYNLVELFPVELHGDLGPMWSLSVEEQFYLVWPLVVVGLLARGMSERRLLVVALGGVVFSALVRAAALPVLGDGIYSFTFTWSDHLLLGAALALFLRTSRRLAPLVVGSSSLPLRSWFLAAGLTSSVVLAGTVLLPGVKSSPVLYLGALTLLALCQAVLVGLVVLFPRAGVSRLLASSPLVWLGRLSYSLYLWNLVVILVVDRHLDLAFVPERLLMLGLTFVLAAGSYFLVERPVLARFSR